LLAPHPDFDPRLLRQALQSQEQHIVALSQELDRLKTEIVRRGERSNALQQELLQALAERDRELVALRSQLASVLVSTSWRAMAPVRRVLRRSPRMARLARRLVKVVWFTVTFQLPTRIRQHMGAVKAQTLASQ
jgi:hypothetical protein